MQLYNTCIGPKYVSESSDVRPENFGLNGAKRMSQNWFKDLTGFMERPAEVAAELLDMGINAIKMWPFDFAKSVADGMDISLANPKRGLKPF
ncbi:MAG: hypothetical protein P8M25_08495 [Paracoccaceae bacterium]|nr:hypothetical protein [Paracoccaceae bacterium]